MTALEEFYEAYLHYSVSQRLFEDRCRQLTESDGTVAERQALVDETLRLAMCVTNNVIDLEPLLGEAADELRNGDGDRDILKALSLISNSIREDRDRADSYTLFVTARRSGNTVRRPRRPRVANPFEFVEEEEDEEEEVVAPTRPKPRPAPVVVPEEPVEEEESEDEEEIPEEDTAEDATEDVEEVAEEEESAEGGETEEPAEDATEDVEEVAKEEESGEEPVEEEAEEAPSHSAAPDRPKPKRRAKPRTEEEESAEVEAPKQGVGSWFRDIGSSLVSHIPRRK